MMTLEQLLPELAGLSRVDKLAVVRSLTQAIEAEQDAPRIDPTLNYEVWSPYHADQAARTLQAFLKAVERDDPSE